jgi:hypothetical protein
VYAVVIRATIHSPQRATDLLPAFKVLPGFVSGEVISLQDGTGLAIIKFQSVAAAQGMIDQWNRSPPPGDILTVADVGFGEILQSV